MCEKVARETECIREVTGTPRGNGRSLAPACRVYPIDIGVVGTFVGSAGAARETAVSRLCTDVPWRRRAFGISADASSRRVVFPLSRRSPCDTQC